MRRVVVGLALALAALCQPAACVQEFTVGAGGLTVRYDIKNDMVVWWYGKGGTNHLLRCVRQLCFFDPSVRGHPHPRRAARAVTHATRKISAV